MTHRNIMFIVAAVVVQRLFAYEEWSTPALTAPTVVGAPAIEVTYQHQFRGNIFGQDRPENLFGLGEGADAWIGIQGIIPHGARVYVSYDTWQLFSRSHNEFTAGAGYAVKVPRLLVRLQADGEIYTDLSTAGEFERRVNGSFVKFSVQNEPLLDRFSLLYSIGYDFGRRAPGMGLTLNAALTETVSLYGSYLPVINRPHSDSGQSEIFNPYLFGVRITTAGHQFMMYAGNLIETGARNPLFGTVDNNLRLGFVIKRLFTW
jgi:hypothetical protein